MARSPYSDGALLRKSYEEAKAGQPLKPFPTPQGPLGEALRRFLDSSGKRL